MILDDLGVERNTEYALEQMFLVIDSRYRSRKPLIVTTNLKLEEIKNPPALVKKIGRTTYIVRIHFSKTSTDTMSDKIKRMLKSEIQQMEKNDNSRMPGIRNTRRNAPVPGL